MQLDKNRFVTYSMFIFIGWNLEPNFYCNFLSYLMSFVVLTCTVASNFGKKLKIIYIYYVYANM